MSKIVICVGHNETTRGAVATNGVAEWTYNKEIADMIAKSMPKVKNLDTVVISPNVQFAKKARRINQETPTIAMELHFNSAADPTATGTEVLHYATSKNGHKLAVLLCDAICEAMQSRNRGPKAIAKREERGGGVLIDTTCPCVILEPFFGSNPADVAAFFSDEGKKKYAEAVAKALAAYFGVIA